MTHESLPRTPLDADDTGEWTLAGEYSALWVAGGKPPDLFAFLNRHPEIDREQRSRLILWDQARSWASDEGRTVEDYLRGDPDLITDQGLLLKLLVREYHLQEPQVAITEFVDRFPQLKPQLLDQLCRSDEPASGLFHSDSAVDSSSMAEATSSLNAAACYSETAHESPASVATAIRPGAPDVESPAADVVEQVAPGGAQRLKNCFPFNSLPVALVNELESHMTVQAYATGEYLIRQGDPGSSLILLRDGAVSVIVSDELGISHEIDRSGPGDILGEMALLTEEPRSASVVAREPVTALVLSAETFHHYAEQNPQISQVLTQLLAQRLGVNRRDVLLGKTMDRYLVLRRLGKGGMSIVYEGVDQESGRRVALKMLSHRLVYDKSSLAWFQREADIIESFENPNIVRMFGRFRAFHSYFIVMEFCDGITFERLVRLNGPMSHDDFRKAFGQLAAAVKYAHDRGVLHRDIKPVNLMLNFDGQVKLMDFGLAMPLGSAHSAADDDQVVGTPRYMAPEQLKGKELTAAADFFAMGCTAYKMLTGESLFTEPDIIKLRELHSHWKVPNCAQHHPDFAPEFCELLEGCLQRRPQKRFCDLDRYAAWAAPLDVTRLL